MAGSGIADQVAPPGALTELAMGFSRSRIICAAARLGLALLVTSRGLLKPSPYYVAPTRYPFTGSCVLLGALASFLRLRRRNLS